MANSPVTPAFLEAVIERCQHAFASDQNLETSTATAILADLSAVLNHLVLLEQRDLAEWIRDLPDDKIGDFLADMEVTARQADSDSDIGSFISALADWQTTAEASRNNW